MESVIGFVRLVILAIIILWVAIRIVPEYQRMVVFRLGRSIGQKGPGVVFLWPVIDRAVRVDLRELFLDIPQQTCVTRDNAPINIDFLVYWKVVDPYLDALRALGASPATKIVFPLEFTTLLRPFAGGAISGEGGGAR